MSMSVALETNSSFLQRLPERQRRKMVSDRIHGLRELFILSLGRILQTSLPLVTFGEEALRRWPILSTPGQLQRAFVENIRLSTTDNTVGAELDVAAAARQGLTQELIWALEYGHPDGVPPLAVWRRASMGVERQAKQALSQLGTDERKRLRQPGAKRHVRVA